ncbi:MAG: hypothetical protein NTZ56_20525 [Acidobacteria bacterium]|nr:hypothetical protein [Acidobacteriota bacterium]
MITLAILVLSQSLTLTPSQTSSFEYRTKLMEAQTAPNNSGLTVDRKAMFEWRYQRLVSAMNKFSEKYKASRGHVWPLKEAAAVKKAFQELERTEPGFSAGQP